MRDARGIRRFANLRANRAARHLRMVEFPLTYFKNHGAADEWKTFWRTADETALNRKKDPPIFRTASLSSAIGALICSGVKACRVPGATYRSTQLAPAVPFRQRPDAALQFDRLAGV